MSIARVNTDYLTGAADAIRRKIGSQNPIPLTQFENEIDNIPTATLTTKTITENGVYSASSDNADGYEVVTVSVPQNPNENFDKFMNNTLTHYSTTATSISNSCFRYKTAMIDIDMPNVTSIANAAFWGCTNLSITSLPALLTSIGESAFRDCSNLAISEIPNGVSVISTAAFLGCQKISITKFPDNIKAIRAESFRGCIGIPFIDVSEMASIPSLSNDAFLNTTFPFYFRDQQQLDEWAAATNWSSLASRFQIKPSGVM